jgi:DNA-binding GntR family transcriptional regulator
VVRDPKYQSIARILEEEIRGFTDGQRVPSENEVAQRFTVARSTARAALQYLTARNVIRRVRGAGSFATHRIDYPIDAERAPSWSATVRAAGARPRSVVRSCTQQLPPAEIAAKLQQLPSELCHRLVRLSFVNDLPAAWGIEWVPTTLVPDLALAMRANDSLHEVLTNAGLSPRRSWVHASTEIFEGEVADQLDAPQSSLGWYIESLNVDEGTLRPVSVTQRWLRADTVRVTFDSAVSSRVNR